MGLSRGSVFVFYCDRCYRTASVNPNEQTALDEARKCALANGWKWKHPHWGLICPDCQKKEVE